MKKLACLLLCFVLHAEVLLTLEKTPYEAFTCSFDFTAVIGTDAMTLVSVTATAVNGTDVSNIIIASSPVPAIIPSTDKVAFRIQNGSLGATYKISVKVIDSVNGQQFEGLMNLMIGN
jgi:hypothetical protein